VIVLPGRAGPSLRSSDRLQHGGTFGVEEPPENPPPLSSRHCCHRRLFSTAQSIVAGVPPGANHAVARASDHHRSVQLRDIQADPDSGRLGDVEGRRSGSRGGGPRGRRRARPTVEQLSAHDVTGVVGTDITSSDAERGVVPRSTAARTLPASAHSPPLPLLREDPAVRVSDAATRRCRAHGGPTRRGCAGDSRAIRGQRAVFGSCREDQAFGRLIGACPQPCGALEYAGVSFSTLAWSGVRSRGRTGPSWLSTSTFSAGDRSSPRWRDRRLLRPLRCPPRHRTTPISETLSPI